MKWGIWVFTEENQFVLKQAVTFPGMVSGFSKQERS